MTKEKSDILKKILFLICIIITFLMGCVFAHEWNVSENAVFYEDANETLFDDAIASLAEAMGKTKRYYNSRLIIKDSEELLDETFDSVYPGTAITFGNNEVFCLKGVSSELGEERIAFIVKNYNDVCLVYPNINYDLYPNGIYDICISPYIDNELIFLSAYTIDDSEKYVSMLMLLDSNFSVVSETTISGTKFCGNTLVTPQGYVLQLSCEDGLSLYRSKSPIKKSLSNFNFSKVNTIDSSEIDSGTMGYFKNQLFALYSDSNANLKCSVSSNKEGSSKWSISKTIDNGYLNPVIQSNCLGNDAEFMCTKIDDDHCYPVLGNVDPNNAKIANIYDFDNKLNVIAGYPCFITHKDGYGCMYFDNIGDDDCAVYYKDIKSNFKDSIPTQLEIATNEAELFLASLCNEKGTSIGLSNKSNISIDYNKQTKKILIKYNYQKYSKYEFGFESKADAFTVSEDELNEIIVLAKLCGYSMFSKYDGIVIGQNGNNFDYKLTSKDGMYNKGQVDNLVAYILKNTYNATKPDSFEGCQKVGHNSNRLIYVGYRKENNFAIKPLATAENANVSKVTYCVDGQEEIVVEPLINIRTPHDGNIHNIVITAYGANGLKVQTTYNYK